MPYISPEKAREMAALSHVARRENKMLPKLQAAIPAIPPLKCDEYTARRLLRVRKQLAQLDDLFANETDASKLDRLASAMYRLAETERILAGRPLPGSRRPPREAPARAPRTSVAPTDE